MLVNVFTYYENRLALKAAGKRRRKRSLRPKRARVPRSGPPWYDTWAFRGALAGLAAGQVLWVLKLRDVVPPAVVCTLLCLWGLFFGMTLDWGLFRMRKVRQALRGDRLGADDVLVLAGRR